MNTLETIIDELKQHEKDFPSHGRGCACVDKQAGALRRLISRKKLDKPGIGKAYQNLLTIFHYIIANP